MRRSAISASVKSGSVFRENLPGNSRISGTHRGWPAIRDDFLAKLRSLSGGTFRAQFLDLAVGAEYIVAVGKGIAEYEGRRLDVSVMVAPCKAG
jgi:hypothetical protein